MRLKLIFLLDLLTTFFCEASNHWYLGHMIPIITRLYSVWDISLFNHPFCIDLLLHSREFWYFCAHFFKAVFVNVWFLHFFLLRISFQGPFFDRELCSKVLKETVFLLFLLGGGESWVKNVTKVTINVSKQKTWQN